jgi:type IV pilus assembly protein PilP
MLTTVLLALSAVYGASGAAGQGPAAAAQPAAPATSPQTAEQPPSPSGYSYNSEGRRDPFLSLVGRGNDAAQGAARAAGIPGLLVNEVTVKGVIRGRSGYIAMIQAPDNKTYIVKSGDRLLDGAVKTITADGVVFSQDVNDPLSLVKQREVPKRVRAGEGRG